MKIRLITIGKTINKNLILLFEEYQNRLKHYVDFDFLVIPELKNTKHLSVNEQKEKEADLLLKAFDAKDDVILLDENGTTYTSVEFANVLEKKRLVSSRRITFVIGGPYGFSDRVYKRANQLMSLSAMTFSHQMVRVIFIEQLYRVFTIIKGEPYHHE